jgi:PPOX class probable F420-dependent enzyme
MTPGEARERFAEARVAHLATVDATGAPHIVPITFAVEGDTIYTAVDAKPKRGTPLRRFANVAANPAASVLVDEYDDDWARLWWARADGRASVLAEGPALDHALALLRARYAQYPDAGPVGPAMQISVERWSGWAAAG